MLKAVAVSSLVLFLPAVVAAQGAAERHGWFYGLSGPAKFSNEGPTVFSAAAGGEDLIVGGLALGGEAAYLAHRAGMGLASVNLSYHFRGRDETARWTPFVTGGGAVSFGSNSASGGANFGGGFQYWVNRRLALRFEARDFIFSSDSPHLLGFRVGVSFR
jgi:hypothetical protein